MDDALLRLQTVTVRASRAYVSTLTEEYYTVLQLRIDQTFRPAEATTPVIVGARLASIDTSRRGLSGLAHGQVRRAIA